MESRELSGLFSTPRWVRDAGIVAWLIVGIGLIVVGVISVLALTRVIVMPLITAMIIASVTAPVISALYRRGLPRAAGAGLVLLAVLVLAIAMAVIVLGGITSQSSDISHQLHSAADKISSGLKDVGVGNHTADNAKAQGTAQVTDGAGLLLKGIVSTLSALASVAAFASFAALSLFFLLKDGPSLRDWVERHSAVPVPVAHTVVGEMMRALRGYFRGVTLVAAFNAVVIGLAALVLGVPLAGTIAVVTFLGAYVPYLGAWAAGAFAVLIALGDQGGGAALAMAVVALLANGALQQIVQPFAFGAALGIHPLAVLIVTLAGGALFGMVGLVLAAPVTSAVVQISRILSPEQAPAASAPI